MIGEKHPMAKLSDGQIAAMRKDHATGKYTNTFLAKRYRVSVTHVGRIVSNKTRG